jgi:hypothetical protein
MLRAMALRTIGAPLIFDQRFITQMSMARVTITTRPKGEQRIGFGPSLTAPPAVAFKRRRRRGVAT